MIKHQILLITAFAAAIGLTGCGGKNSGLSNPSAETENISGEAEKHPENIAEESSVSEDVYIDETFPGNGYVRSSLTNLWIKQEYAEERPIAVMMPVDSFAQPQYNIGNAGILYEALEEGGVSRQMAIIEGWQNMEKIGNIRSIRSYFVWLGAEWDSILVLFGGPYHAQTAITAPGVDYITGTAIGQENTRNQRISSGAFFRTADKRAPHNAYTSANLLHKSITSLGYEIQHRDRYWNSDHFIFAAPSNPNTLAGYPHAENAAIIDLSNIFPYTSTRLEYNEADGVYYKWLLKSRQIDAADENKDQLTFSNVIIQMAEMEVLDIKGYLDFRIIGTGTGYYCTQGKSIPITWEKTSGFSPTKYYDINGSEIILNTGKTYIAIAPKDKFPIFE